MNDRLIYFILFYFMLNVFRYTSKMLLAAIDETHKGTYDFLYLPIDFKVMMVNLPTAVSFTVPTSPQTYVSRVFVQNKCNVGYAFINMVSSSHIVSFYQVTFPFLSW